jgi:hypothetical protein
VIAALVALAAFLVYHFTVHTIVNRRPLGGTNVPVLAADFDQSQAAFAVDPSAAQHLFGASNDAGLEVLRIYESANGGKTWKATSGPAVPGGSCANGEPSVAVDGSGREYLAFLASKFCGDSLTPYLVVTSRASPTGRWAPLARVVRAAWKYGFDDAPAIAVDDHSQRVYVAWTRGLAKSDAGIVLSTSTDGARTWSAPRAISGTLVHAHRARVAVASNGDVYVAGFDAKLGVWITRSTNRGATFADPRTAAELLANPAGGCALTAGDPLPRELATCEGPDPTLSVGANRVYVVYGDAGSDQTLDVYAATLTRSLRAVSRVQVNPVDSHKTQQFMPVSAVDPTTGVLWACWYDTTYDPHAHRAWFTCAASHDGRTWTAPLRAASVPTEPPTLYGTLGGSGLYPALAAAHGVAHPFWADGRVIRDSTDIYTAAIPERAAFAQAASQ